MNSDWASYRKWSLSLARDVLAHLEFLLLSLITLPRRALEIGTGTGLHSVFISYFGVQVIAIDQDKKVIKMALTNVHRYKAKDVIFVVADALYLPFRNQVFDLCFSQGLLEHFDDNTIRNIVSETLRAAQKIMFSVPSVNYPTHDLGNERLLTPYRWSKILTKFDAKARYYVLDLQLIKNSLLHRKVSKPWHILIRISYKKAKK
jgi:SAM-dependent methyltransferase